ncbi:MAG: hypothetical protein GXP38_15410 [Chloroflexi bacterium]|nr:hypothetical protein [Chloroflexota bacterium]
MTQIEEMTLILDIRLLAGRRLAEKFLPPAHSQDERRRGEDILPDPWLPTL